MRPEAPPSRRSRSEKKQSKPAPARLPRGERERPEPPEYRLPRSEGMRGPLVVTAEVIDYSHVKACGSLMATVEKKLVRLTISNDHLRAAGLATLSPKQKLRIRVGWLVIDQPRVEAILTSVSRWRTEPVSWFKW